MTSTAIEPVDLTAGTLHLRPWQPYHADEVLRICQDPEIQRWTRVPVPYTADAARSYVEEVSPRGWEQGTEASFAVLDITTAEVLASVGLVRIHHADSVAEVGLWVAPHARGRHVGSDAAGAVCRWAFGALGLRRLEWVADVDNPASIACATRVGFRLDGVLRARLTRRDGSQGDAWLGSLLPGEA